MAHATARIGNCTSDAKAWTTRTRGKAKHWMTRSRDMRDLQNLQNLLGVIFGPCFDPFFDPEKHIRAREHADTRDNIHSIKF
ncbi:Retrotransposon gag protein [Arachis hypogaea]|nr:Retrotransposon gag protein [Arachis hypogaea]